MLLLDEKHRGVYEQLGHKNFVLDAATYKDTTQRVSGIERAPDDVEIQCEGGY